MNGPTNTSCWVHVCSSGVRGLAKAKGCVRRLTTPHHHMAHVRVPIWNHQSDKRIIMIAFNCLQLRPVYIQTPLARYGPSAELVIKGCWSVPSVLSIVVYVTLP